MGNENGKFDYEKRIADYRASTDQKALEWRAAVLGMDEKEQKRTYFRFAVADGRMTGRPLFPLWFQIRAASGC